MAIENLIKFVKDPFTLSAFVVAAVLWTLTQANVIKNKSTREAIQRLAFLTVGGALLIGIIKSLPDGGDKTTGTGAAVVKDVGGSVSISTTINGREAKNVPEASSSASR